MSGITPCVAPWEFCMGAMTKGGNRRNYRTQALHASTSLENIFDYWSKTVTLHSIRGFWRGKINQKLSVSSPNPSTWWCGGSWMAPFMMHNKILWKYIEEFKWNMFVKYFEKYLKKYFTWSKHLVQAARHRSSRSTSSQLSRAAATFQGPPAPSTRSKLRFDFSPVFF